MSWMDQLGSIVSQYTGGGTGSGNVEQDFNKVAQSAPPNVLASGISDAFRSDQTPAFGQMVSQMYSQSNGQQQAGLLNHLLSSLGPGTLSSLAASGAMAALPGALSGMLSGGHTQVTPEQAQQIPPDVVQQIAAHAEKNNPSVVDQVSGFYAQHPDLVKGLGITALTIAMGRMARHA